MLKFIFEMSYNKITNFYTTASMSVSASAADTLKQKHELETENSQIID